MLGTCLHSFSFALKGGMIVRAGSNGNGSSGANSMRGVMMHSGDSMLRASGASVVGPPVAGTSVAGGSSGNNSGGNAGGGGGGGGSGGGGAGGGGAGNGRGSAHGDSQQSHLSANDYTSLQRST